VSGSWQTHVDAEIWEPMEVAGVVVGEVHLLRSEEGDRPYSVGLWRVLGELPAPFDYDFEQNETIHVLEGAVTIDVGGEPAIELGPGDIASFAPGSRARWRVSRVPFKELFVLS